MSAEQGVVYSQKMQLYTLKGDVTVTFFDGESFTGRIVKQDMLNLFFLVEGEVRMVSRSQVWYVSAISYSQIGEDTESMPTPSVVTAESPPARESEDVPTLQPDVAPSPEPEPEPQPEPQPEPEPEPEPESVDDYVFATEFEPAPSAPEPEPTMLDFEAPKTELDFPVPEFDLESDEAEENDDTAVLRQAEPQVDEEITYVLREEANRDAAPSPAAARLVCTGGPHVGESWEFSGDAITLGRASYNNISLSLDKEISRNHAVIRLEGGQFSVEDQDSLNGVFVNQEKISTAGVLQDGDVILVGVSTLEFMIG